MGPRTQPDSECGKRRDVRGAVYLSTAQKGNDGTILPFAIPDTSTQAQQPPKTASPNCKCMWTVEAARRRHEQRLVSVALPVSLTFQRYI